MCGLCGVASRYLNKVEMEVFGDLLTVCTLRGRYGAGLVGVPTKRESFPSILRTEYTGAALATSEAFDKLTKTQMNVLIGHTRMPTTGSFDLEHIHPFRHEHIIGVHNGTFHRIMGQEIPKDASDSDTFYKAVAENGIKKTIEESQGAYSLVWYDAKEETLNFLRNSQRPLWFHCGDTPHVNTLYWASEPRMLDLCVTRKLSYGKHQIVQSKENIHYSMPLWGRGSFTMDEEEIKPRYSFQGVNEYYYGIRRASAYGEWWGDCDWVGSRTPVNTTREEEAPKTNQNDGSQSESKTYLALEDKRPHRPSVPTVNARDLPKAIEEIIPGTYRSMMEIHRNLQNGCTYCSHPEIVMSHKTGKILWWTADRFICESCQKSDMVIDVMEGLFGPRPEKPVIKADPIPAGEAS